MEVHHDDQSPHSRFNDLPVEIIRKILEKLAIDSVARCKLLNKSFCKIIKDQHFTINLFSSAVKKNPFVFISYHKSFYLRSTDSNLYDEFKEIHTPFHLPHAYINIVGSCNGYVCLTASSSHVRSFRDKINPRDGRDHHEDTNFLWNPLTANFIELPASTKRCSWIFGFGFHPLTQEYKVVKIYYIRDAPGSHAREYMQILTVGKDVWRNLKGPSYFGSRSLRWNKRGVCVDGLVYWYGQNESHHLAIFALDLATEEFTEIRAPYDMDWTICQNLTEIKGCLAMMVFQGDQEHLEIWTLKDSWTLQCSIENYPDKIDMVMLMEFEERGELTTTGRFSYYFDHAIWLLEGDRLLIYFGSGGILCYDFKNEVFSNFKVRLPGHGGDPYEYEVIAFDGNLICID